MQHALFQEALRPVGDRPFRNAEGGLDGEHLAGHQSDGLERAAADVVDLHAYGVTEAAAAAGLVALGELLRGGFDVRALEGKRRDDVLHLAARFLQQLRNGDARPGNPCFLDLDVPTAGGLAYVMAGSLGVRPGLTLGDGRTIPLNLDPVLILSLVDPFTFQNFQSVLDAVGHATATFHVPMIPALTGQRFYFAFVLLDPAAPLGIRLVSNPWGVSIR